MNLNAQTARDAGWQTYGGDPGGQRFSQANQIDRDNVRNLQPIWTFHTEALKTGRPGHRSASFESTPILFHDTLYVSTPFDVVFALDPMTGAQRWKFDPEIGHVADGNIVTSRGVASWQDKSPAPGTVCPSRIFIATLVGKLAAVDADTGKPCADFGVRGQIDLRQGVDFTLEYDSYAITSPPTVVGDIVVVGSSIGDNRAVDMPRGSVRGFDVRTGRQLWSWEPIPWALSQKVRTGAANAWSIIAADPQLGLIFIPTGSASPDYYGGMRPGDNRDADSVVALEAATGKKVWAFQTVHHNLWDYDVAAEPLLFTLHNDIPAIAISTKTGMVFVLDRRSGAPLYPIVERAVPQSDIAGDQSSATQPISSLPTFSPLTVALGATGGWERSRENREYCEQRLKRLRYEGLYTPPGIGGTLVYPGPLGGVNWGGAAFDPTTGTIYANNNRLPYAVRLIPADDQKAGPRSANEKFKAEFHSIWMRLLWLHQPPVWFSVAAVLVIAFALRRRSLNPGWLPVATAGGLLVVGLVLVKHYRTVENEAVAATFGLEHGPNSKAPYLTVREPLVDRDGTSCLPPPFGALTAINLETGTKVFEEALGTSDSGKAPGSVSLGGPIVTAGGLVFTAGTKEKFLRAFDTRTGHELWKGELPVPAQSTPMSYSIQGKQFVVIAAGGHGAFGTEQGDSLIAFSLPK